MMGALDAELKIRIEAAWKAALEAKAGRDDRTPAAIARRYIRDGLIRDGLIAAAVERE